MIKKIVISTATAIALVGCAEVGGTIDEAATRNFLSQEELLATIPGSTFYGVSRRDPNNKWVQTYSSGGTSGTIAGTWNGEPYNSTWSVDGEVWCEVWEQGSGCYRFVKVSDSELAAYRDDNEEFVNTWNMR